MPAVNCHTNTCRFRFAEIAGCHVYSEKPLASDLASADRIVAAAEQHNRKVAVAHQAVYLRQVHQVRDLLREKRIGKLLSMHAYGKQDHRGGGEDMLVLGTSLNMMRFFGGDPLWMTARVTVGNREIAPEDVREAQSQLARWRAMAWSACFLLAMA